MATSFVTHAEQNGRIRNKHVPVDYGMSEISFMEIDTNQGEPDRDMTVLVYFATEVLQRLITNERKWE